MSKRKPVETSLEAYRNLDPVRLSQLQQDIVRAVTALGEANFEAVAAFLMVKPGKIWRRMSEVERSGAIYKPGNMVLTKDGAKSYVYRATTPGTPSLPVTEKAMPGKGVNDYAKQIIQNTLF